MPMKLMSSVISNKGQMPMRNTRLPGDACKKVQEGDFGPAKKCTAVFTSTTTMPIVVKIETAAHRYRNA